MAWGEETWHGVAIQMNGTVTIIRIIIIQGDCPTAALARASARCAKKSVAIPVVVRSQGERPRPLPRGGRGIVLLRVSVVVRRLTRRLARSCPTADNYADA